MDTDNKHISLTGACQRLRIPYQRAWMAVVSGAVIATREGGRWQIPESELDGLYEACVKGANHAA